VVSEFIALSLLVGICYSGYIQTHCQRNKKIKLAEQILPEVYGTTLNTIYYAFLSMLHFFYILGQLVSLILEQGAGS
jgi:hypothetical protein